MYFHLQQFSTIHAPPNLVHRRKHMSRLPQPQARPPRARAVVVVETVIKEEPPEPEYVWVPSSEAGAVRVSEDENPDDFVVVDAVPKFAQSLANP